MVIRRDVLFLAAIAAETVCHGYSDFSAFVRPTSLPSVFRPSTASRRSCWFAVSDTENGSAENGEDISASSRSGFNVVLSPSTHQEDAFDNFKVGNCRVHRYSSDKVSGSNIDLSTTTEYVMWYHGRDRTLHNHDGGGSSNRLPPLSTGRIGRATSRNGLAWEKDITGSASEDMSGVSLGLNSESWWSFDTQHVGLGSVLLPLSTPAVLSADGVYLMYYMGGNGEETLMSNYLDDTDLEKLPDNMKDAVLRGMKMKIGVAISQDGITWGRVEGDDPSGACMVPYSKTDPNQNRNNQNTDIPEELYCAWPEVVVNTSPRTNGESFVMYYSTMTKDDKQKVIAYAVSEDGFRWFKRGVCLAPSNDDDGKGCARCFVEQDAVFDEDTMQWSQVENAWTMYYEGVSTIDNKHRIFVAKSTDGMTWKKMGMALDVGTASSWDCKGVGSPHCIR
jgi:hypothetical protein